MTPPKRLLATVFVTFATTATEAPAVVLLHNTFDLGTDGWTVGAPSPVPPSRSPSGGPGGPSDPYLLTQSLNIPGPGGRLAVFNQDSAWLGDYTFLGLDAIEVDLRNFGATALTIRVGLEGLAPDQTVHRAVTAATHVLAPFSQWEHARFSLLPGDLVAVGASQDPASTLENITQIRFLHQPAPQFQGAIVGAAMGLDNIQAIPEPRVAILILMGGFCLIPRRRSALPD